MQNATELQLEALSRATQSESFTNYPAIYSGLMAKGIAEADIVPRVNVFTFHAWKAKGRVVRKGEHGVKVITWVPIRDKVTGEVTGKRPKSAVVFHITQTKELGAADSPSHDAAARQMEREHAEQYIRDPGEDSADRWLEANA